MYTSDEEMVLEAEAHDVSPALSRTRKAASVFGMVGMLCMVAGYLTLSTQPKTSGRSLLESDDFAEAATDRIMELRRQEGLPIDDVERMKVKSEMLSMSKSYTAHIQNSHPNLGKAVDGVLLTEDERKGVLHIMRMSSDPRLRSVASDVVNGMHDAANMDSNARHSMVMEKMKPRAAELRQLKDEIFGKLPESLRTGRRDTFDRLMKEANQPEERRLQYPPMTTTPQLYNPYVPTTTPVDMFQEAKDSLAAMQVGMEAMSPTLKQFAIDNKMCILADLADSGVPVTKVLKCWAKVGQKMSAGTTGSPGSMPFNMDNMIQASACPGQLGDASLAAIQAIPCDLGMDDTASDCTRADAEQKDGKGTC